MRNGIIASLALFAMLASIPRVLHRQEQTQPPQKSGCEPTPEDYSVYSAVLDDFGPPEDPEEEWRGKKIIISDQTDVSQKADNAPWGFRSPSKQRPLAETIKNFDARMTSPCHLQALLKTKLSASLVSADDLSKIFKKRGDGWQRFYARYPGAGGYWTFSTVGYSENGEEALVYVGHHCGSLCGTGHLFLLAKENGTWIVKNRTMLWIS